MIPVQDIDFITKNSKQIRVMLSFEKGGYFVSLQERILQGDLAGYYSEFSKPLVKFNSSKEAFEYSIKAFSLVLSYSKDSIVKANNPSGCELSSVSDQKEVCNELNLQITVEENLI